jgi:hypothetical protein
MCLPIHFLETIQSVTLSIIIRNAVVFVFVGSTVVLRSIAMCGFLVIISAQV